METGIDTYDDYLIIFERRSVPKNVYCQNQCVEGSYGSPLSYVTVILVGTDVVGQLNCLHL
jgi:hypothetical protein